MKGIKTTIIAFIILLLGSTLTIALIYGKIDSSTFDRGMIAIGVLGTAVIGFMAKDVDSSHTFDSKKGITAGAPDPNKEQK